MTWFNNKSVIDKILLIIGAIVFVLLFSTLQGCSLMNLGSKKVTETNKETSLIEKTEIKKDSFKTEIVSKRIDDAITIEVPVSDPEIDAKIDEILSKLNMSKSSGDNSYRFYYDSKLRELRAEFEIGETKDSEIIKSEETISEKSLTEKTEEYISKKIKTLPWWIWLIGIWLIRKHIINIIGIFVPGVKGIKTVQDLLNPPKKE